MATTASAAEVTVLSGGAVKKGAPVPDISSAEAKALLEYLVCADARSVFLARGFSAP